MAKIVGKREDRSGVTPSGFVQRRERKFGIVKGSMLDRVYSRYQKMRSLVSQPATVEDADLPISRLIQQRTHDVIRRNIDLTHAVMLSRGVGAFLFRNRLKIA
jgi:hypothetical protein